MNLPFEIIHESNHWLAINKAAGMVVEENPFSESAEVYLKEHYRGTKGNFHLGIVHRLDRVTSGVLLVAKRKSSLRKMNQQFQDQQVNKVYLAEVHGDFPAEITQLDHWLMRDETGKKAVTAARRFKKSKHARLEIKKLSSNGKTSLLEVVPTGGRYHQIRVQLAEEGFPIVKDKLYGAKGPDYPKFIHLHAWKVACIDPETDKPISLEAEKPDWAKG